MKASDFTRHPPTAENDLKLVGNQRYITQKGCQILIPARYREAGLVKIGAETYVLGMLAYVVGSRYSVMRIPAMFRTEPSQINNVVFDADPYLELVYEAGDTVIANKDIVQDDALLYEIYDEFFAKGHVPWFFNYYDVGRLFAESPYYTGVRLGANHAVLEMLAATICRAPDKPTQFYRQFVERKEDVEKNPPFIIKLSSVSYGATNTTAKLIGAYWEEGLNSALVNPSDKVEPIEDLLRR